MSNYIPTSSIKHTLALRLIAADPTILSAYLPLVDIEIEKHCRSVDIYSMTGLLRDDGCVKCYDLQRYGLFKFYELLFYDRRNSDPMVHPDDDVFVKEHLEAKKEAEKIKMTLTREVILGQDYAPEQRTISWLMQRG